MIIIEGLIGVGKSTLSEGLGEILNYKVLKEPVEDNPYLEKFYRDPKRYALEMQFWLMSKRFSMHQEAIDYIWRTGNGIIMDRSIYGDAIFAKQNFDDGNIDSIGFDNYIKMREVMFRFLMIPQVTIYLEASPYTCQTRIAKRDRSCEQLIPIDYLSGLDKHYRSLLEELERKGSNIVKIDWEEFKSVDYVVSKLKQENLLSSNFTDYPKIQSSISEKLSNHYS